ALGGDGRSPRARDRRPPPHGPRGPTPALAPAPRARPAAGAAQRAPPPAPPRRPGGGPAPRAPARGGSPRPRARPAGGVVAGATAKGGEPEGEEPALLQGWRRTLVGDTLLAIARGELALRYDPARRELVTNPFDS